MQIFTNFRQRKAGEMSAYSVFNDGFRELPGTMNAAMLQNNLLPGMGAAQQQQQHARERDDDDHVDDAELERMEERQLQEALRRSMRDA